MGDGDYGRMLRHSIRGPVINATPKDTERVHQRNILRWLGSFAMAAQAVFLWVWVGRGASGCVGRHPYGGCCGKGSNNGKKTAGGPLRY